MVFIADLCAQVSEHANSPEDQSSSSYITSHDFWLDHYNFENVLSSLTQAAPVEATASKDQFAIISIQCAMIYLQKGAIDRGKKIPSMEAVVKDCAEKCLQAAMKIANVVQLIAQSKSTSVRSPIFICGPG